MFIIEDESRVKELLKQGKLDNCSAISLPNSSIYKHPGNLECPGLKLLVLFNKNPHLKVPDTFFEKLNELLVLDLAGLNFSSLPSSFTFLRSLEKLCFDECKLNDIAIIGKLKQLNTLRIHSPNIEKLPQEIGRLTWLRSLDLSNCSKFKFIPENTISHLSFLEELVMRNSFDQWDVKGNASLSELKSLSITTLDVHIRSAQIMPTEIFFEKLDRYKILIEEVWDWSGKYENERMLKIKLTKGVQFDHGVQLLLQMTEDLYVDELKGVKSLLYELDSAGFPELKNLYVQNGSGIQFIIDFEDSGKAFPILESVFLQNPINLEKICQGKLEEESFNRLKVISIKSCDQLKNPFQFSMTKMLLQLQEIKVSKCKSIEEIFVKDGEIATDRTEFSQLRSLTLQLLPELGSFCSKDKGSFHLSNGPSEYKVLATFQ